MEFLKVRQQSYSAAPAREPNLWRLARDIARTEGPRPFYSGLSAGLYRAVISGGGRIAIYNQLKLSWGARDGAGTTDHVRVMFGMAAGVAAAIFAVPFDLIRTRQQVVQKGPSLSMMAVVQHILRHGTVTDLWIGAGPTFARQAVFTGTQLAWYSTLSTPLPMVL